MIKGAARKLARMLTGRSEVSAVLLPIRSINKNKNSQQQDLIDRVTESVLQQPGHPLTKRTHAMKTLSAWKRAHSQLIKPNEEE